MQTQANQLKIDIEHCPAALAFCRDEDWDALLKHLEKCPECWWLRCQKDIVHLETITRKEL